MAMELAPGRYVGTILSHEIGQAKSGSLQIVFKVNVTGEIDPDNEGEIIELAVDKKRTIYETVSDNTIERVIKTLKLLGYKERGFKQLDAQMCEELGLNFVDLSGTEVPLTCEKNVYQEKENERWRFGFDIGGGGVVKKAERSQVDEEEAKYAAMFDDEEEEEEAPKSKANAAPSKPAPSKPGNGKNGKPANGKPATAAASTKRSGKGFSTKVADDETEGGTEEVPF